ncbi:hypothetical protein P5E67_05000 [Vibrio parahaemolyticus]|nr:hypothetical protein [Vibrio parahaemolyticus]
MARRIITTRRAVQMLQNCTADIYVDSGEELDGVWYPSFRKIDSVPGNFQKAPKNRIIHLEDGSEMKVGIARLSLTRAPKDPPRLIGINGEFWKVSDNRTRESRLQYKYELEYQYEQFNIVGE